MGQILNKTYVHSTVQQRNLKVRNKHPKWSLTFRFPAKTLHSFFIYIDIDGRINVNKLGNAGRDFPFRRARFVVFLVSFPLNPAPLCCVLLNRIRVYDSRLLRCDRQLFLRLQLVPHREPCHRYKEKWR